MVEKRLGWITSAKFGRGGYQDAEIGLSLAFGGDGWGVHTFFGAWFDGPTEFAKWTVEDQRGGFADAVELVRDTLRDAKRDHVSNLVGVPVELTFDGTVLLSWRVLTEVIG